MLDEVTGRLVAIAEEAQKDERPVADELFEIERRLQAGARRLTKLVAELGGR